jgi:hypothetical protein
VTITAKIRNPSQLKFIDTFLANSFKGLKVKAQALNVSSRGWIQVKISGEDEKVALHYLLSKFGICPASLDQIKKFTVLKGYLATIESADRLDVDVGVNMPTVVNATIPLQSLQACLVDGRKIALKKIAELFGFTENLPVTVKISSVDKEKMCLEATLSDEQIKLYHYWIFSLLDRLIILGASYYQIKKALKVASCSRDIVSVKPLGLFEWALECKLGTDAIGLIPKIGKNLPNATFSVFKSREIWKFLGNSSVF